MTRTYRRLVTGETAEGKAVFVSDEQVEATAFSNSPPETGIWKLWGSNSTAALPADGKHFDYDTIFPPTSGFRCEILSLRPESATVEPLPPEQLAAELAERFPGIAAGSHATDTVDLIFILDGEIWLELDDGEERLLQQGDIAVQHGTLHEWHNRSDTICTMAAILIGAPRS